MWRGDALEPALASHSPSGPGSTPRVSAAIAIFIAASPIIREASAFASMAAMPMSTFAPPSAERLPPFANELAGVGSKNSGVICQCLAARILVRAWVLRELGARAMRRAWRMGTLLRRRRLRTLSLEAMARSGRMVSGMPWLTMRWYSIAGMMARLAAPVRRASAHRDGTVKENSYFFSARARRGPWVKPRVNGAVLRYCTTEMRSLVTLTAPSAAQQRLRAARSAV